MEKTYHLLDSLEMIDADIEWVREQLQLRRQASEEKDSARNLTDRYIPELEALRGTAEQARSSREAPWLRAEQAEKLAAGLTAQLDRVEAKADERLEQLNSMRRLVQHEQMARKLAEGEVRALRDELEAERNARKAESMERTERCRCAYDQDTEASPSLGITFPYATKQLEAMRDAALAHWASHDRSTPAPYGIQKTVANFLATRTGQNARKLAELAIAIKPDDLPKA